MPFGGVPRRVTLTHRELADLGLRALAGYALACDVALAAGGGYYMPIAGTRIGCELGANEPLFAPSPLSNAWNDDNRQHFTAAAKHWAREGAAVRDEAHIARMAAGRQKMTLEGLPLAAPTRSAPDYSKQEPARDAPTRGRGSQQGVRRRDLG